ncbi:unnamed protein product [Agarophyton chilense]
MFAFINNIFAVPRTKRAKPAQNTCSATGESADHRIRSTGKGETAKFSRREIMHVLAAIAMAPGVLPQHVNAAAAAGSVKLGGLEKGEAYGYSYASPPESWSRSTASLSSFRVATVFVNDEDGDSNINMVVTPVSGDFRKLTSFGTVDNVLQTIIPKSGKDIEGSLIGYEDAPDKNAYVFEYTITSQGVKRHLLTLFSLQPGKYLLTLTGQAKEDNWKANEPVMRAVIDSYKLQIMD